MWNMTGSLVDDDQVAVDAKIGDACTCCPWWSSWIGPLRCCLRSRCQYLRSWWWSCRSWCRSGGCSLVVIVVYVAVWSLDDELNDVTIDVLLLLYDIEELDDGEAVLCHVAVDVSVFCLFFDDDEPLSDLLILDVAVVVLNVVVDVVDVSVDDPFALSLFCSRSWCATHWWWCYFCRLSLSLSLVWCLSWCWWTPLWWCSCRQADALLVVLSILSMNLSLLLILTSMYLLLMLSLMMFAPLLVIWLFL